MTEPDFTIIANEPFVRMNPDVLVIGITFEQLMVKLKHMDISWRHGL